MADFTPVDVGAAHMAMVNAIEAAKSRRAKNPNASSAEAFDNQAARLRILRDKILDELPEPFHQHRLAYPDYRPSVMGVAVRISQAAEPNTIGVELLTDRQS